MQIILPIIFIKTKMEASQWRKSQKVQQDSLEKQNFVMVELYR